MTPDKTQLHNKFIEKFSQGTIFYKQPFLPSEIKYIFDSIDIRVNLEKRLERLEKQDAEDLQKLRNDFANWTEEEIKECHETENWNLSFIKEFKSILENPIR